MLTGISRIARAAPPVVRPALLLVGCLATAAAISWSRSGRPDPEALQPAPSPSAAEAARRPGLGDERTSGSETAATFQLTEQQQRGKRIYSTGISPAGGKMMAVL